MVRIPINMMLGGGFLKQGADSTKYNRSLLGKEKRKPFERKDDVAKSGMPIVDKGMSNEVLLEIRRQNAAYERSAIRRTIIICVIIFVLLIVGLVAMFM